MEELADISLFNQLQGNANSAQLSDVSVFNLFDYRQGFFLFKLVWRSRNKEPLEAMKFYAEEIMGDGIANSWRNWTQPLPTTTDEAQQILKKDLEGFKTYFYRQVNNKKNLTEEERTLIDTIYEIAEKEAKKKVDTYVLEDNLLRGIDRNNYAPIFAWSPVKTIKKSMRMLFDRPPEYSQGLADMIYKDFCQRNTRITGVDERLLSFDMERPALERYIKGLCLEKRGMMWVPFFFDKAADIVRQKIRDEAGEP